MNSHDTLIARNTRKIQALVARFSGHPGIDRPLIDKWLTQFHRNDLQLALKILHQVTYFTRTNIESLCETIVEIAYTQLSSFPRTRVLFVTAGRIWDGEACVARFLKHSGIIPRSQVTDYLGLQQQESGKWDAVVLVKDFSGTGNQLSDWWKDTGEMLILPLEVEVHFGVLVLNSIARSRLEAELLSVFASRELPEDHSVFNARNRGFSSEEKQTIQEYCHNTGASPDFVKGFGGCGLLVAFDYGCPNNSIPLLWYDSVSWSALFRRRC